MVAVVVVVAAVMAVVVVVVVASCRYEQWHIEVAHSAHIRHGSSKKKKPTRFCQGGGVLSVQASNRAGPFFARCQGGVVQLCWLLGAAMLCRTVS